MEVDSKLRGIIYELTQRNGGNVHDLGFVTISAHHTHETLYGSSINGGHPKYVADLTTDIGWYDANSYPSWICFDFKTSLRIVHYSIKFGYSACNSVQQWILEGSSNNETWSTIDDRTYENIMHPDFSIDEYDVITNPENNYRYIRISIPFGFWGGNYILGMSAIDFFGDLSSKQYYSHSLTFCSQSGSYTNDTYGYVSLSGSIFTSILPIGTYRVGAWSKSSSSFVGGTLILRHPSNCIIYANDSFSDITSFYMGEYPILKAPFSTSLEPPFVSNILHDIIIINDSYIFKPTPSGQWSLMPFTQGTIHIYYSSFTNEFPSCFRIILQHNFVSGFVVFHFLFVY